MSGTTVETSQHNPPLEDIAEALTGSLPRDGSAPMTGALDMGANKLVNLAAGASPSDAARMDQVQPASAALTALGALTPAADKLPYFTGASTSALTDISAYMRGLLDTPGASVLRSDIGAVGTGAGNLLGSSANDLLLVTDGFSVYRISTGATGIAAGANVGDLIVSGVNATKTGATQIILCANGGMIQRRYEGGAWTAWARVLDTSSAGSYTMERPFESEEQTFALGTNLTITHGLGSVPKLFQVLLVCKIAEAGFAVNDEVEAPNSTGSNTGISRAANATSIVIRAGSSALPLGNLNNITPANWRIKVRAWK